MSITRQKAALTEQDQKSIDELKELLKTSYEDLLFITRDLQYPEDLSIDAMTTEYARRMDKSEFEMIAARFNEYFRKNRNNEPLKSRLERFVQTVILLHRCENALRQNNAENFETEVNKLFPTRVNAIHFDELAKAIYALTQCRDSLLVSEFSLECEKIIKMPDLDPEHKSQLTDPDFFLCHPKVLIDMILATPFYKKNAVGEKEFILRDDVRDALNNLFWENWSIDIASMQFFLKQFIHEYDIDPESCEKIFEIFMSQLELAEGLAKIRFSYQMLTLGAYPNFNMFAKTAFEMIAEREALTSECLLYAARIRGLGHYLSTQLYHELDTIPMNVKAASTESALRLLLLARQELKVERMFKQPSMLEEKEKATQAENMKNDYQLIRQMNIESPVIHGTIKTKDTGSNAKDTPEPLQRSSTELFYSSTVKSLDDDDDNDDECGYRRYLSTNSP